MYSAMLTKKQHLLERCEPHFKMLFRPQRQGRSGRRKKRAPSSAVLRQRQNNIMAHLEFRIKDVDAHRRTALLNHPTLRVKVLEMLSIFVRCTRRRQRFETASGDLQRGTQAGVLTLGGGSGSRGAGGSGAWHHQHQKHPTTTVHNEPLGMVVAGSTLLVRHQSAAYRQQRKPGQQQHQHQQRWHQRARQSSTSTSTSTSRRSNKKSWLPHHHYHLQHRQWRLRCQRHSHPRHHSVRPTCGPTCGLRSRCLPHGRCRTETSLVWCKSRAEQASSARVPPCGCHRSNGGDQPRSASTLRSYRSTEASGFGWTLA